MKKTILKKLALAICIPMLFFAVLEAGLRWFEFSYTRREKLFLLPTVHFMWNTYSALLKTIPVEGQYLFKTEPNTRLTGPHGFRRPEPPKQKSSGVIRVAFLGGSTTQGGYYPYPERAIEILNRVAGTNRYEMLNAGCSSYSTLQSKRLLEQEILDWRPDIVFVYHSWNDSTCDDDGYSDAEKDRIASLAPCRVEKEPAVPSSWRIMRLVAWGMDTLDVRWPRLRVEPKPYRRNLVEIVERCGEIDVPVIVMISPSSRRGKMATSDRTARWSKRLKLDPDELYVALHDAYTAIQRDVVIAYDHTRECDAEAYFATVGNGLHLFEDDFIHCTFLGEWLLGECAALAIAPDRQQDIEHYLASAEYATLQVARALQELQIEAADVLLDEAVERDPDMDVSELVAGVETSREFAALWWKGSPFVQGDFDVKFAALSRCIQMRPEEVNACSAMLMLCDRAGVLSSAAGPLALCEPATLTDLLIWYELMFDLSVETDSPGQALYYAMMIQYLDSGHDQTRQFVAFLQTDPRWSESVDYANSRIGQYDFAQILDVGVLRNVANPDVAREIVRCLRALQAHPEDEAIRGQLRPLCIQAKSLDMLITFSGLNPPCVMPVSALNDGDIATVARSEDTLEDVSFYIEHPDPFVAIRLFLVVDSEEAGSMRLKDICVVATNDDPSGKPQWNRIDARVLGPPESWGEVVRLPNSPDRTTICLELSPRYQESGQKYKTWGIACLSSSQGYERNYAGDDVVAVREMLVCAQTPPPLIEIHRRDTERTRALP